MVTFLILLLLQQQQLREIVFELERSVSREIKLESSTPFPLARQRAVANRIEGLTIPCPCPVGLPTFSGRPAGFLFQSPGPDRRRQQSQLLDCLASFWASRRTQKRAKRTMSSVRLAGEISAPQSKTIPMKLIPAVSGTCR